MKDKEQYIHTLKVEFQKKINELVTKNREEIKNYEERVKMMKSDIEKKYEALKYGKKFKALLEFERSLKAQENSLN